MIYKNLVKLFRFESENTYSTILITYIALYFFFPYKIFGLPTTLNTLFMILTAPFVLPLLKFDIFQSISKKELFALGAFFIFFLVNNLIVHRKSNNLIDLIPFFVSFVTFGYVFLLARKLKLETLFNIFFIYLMLSGIVIFLEVFWGPDFYISNYFQTSRKAISRLASGFSNSSLHGGGLVIIVYTFCVFYSMVFTNNFLKKFKDYLILFVGLFATFYTMSRAAWLSFALCVILMALLNLFMKKYKTAVSVLWVVTIFTVGLFALCFVPPKLYYAPGPIMSRVAINFNLPFAKHPVFRSQYDENIVYNEVYYEDGKPVKKSDLSGNIRILSLKLTMKLIPENWFNGVGMGRFPELFNLEYRKLITANLDIYDRLFYANTHNTFLSYLVEMGSLVGLPLIFLVIFVFFRLCKLAIKDIYYLPLLALFTVTVCWCQFIDVSRDRVFYIVAALCWSLSYMSPKIKAKSE